MSTGHFDALRILIAEDNKYMQEILVTLLLVLGIRHIDRAETTAQALSLIAKHDYDFVLIDIEMAPIGGIELTRLLRRAPDTSNPYVPIIIVTGHTNKAIVEEARDAGMTEFLAKPVTAQMLCRRIKEIVERPRPFIRTPTFVGPDRRRQQRNHLNQGRRAEDRGEAPEPIVLDD